MATRSLEPPYNIVRATQLLISLSVEVSVGARPLSPPPDQLASIILRQMLLSLGLTHSLCPSQNTQPACCNVDTSVWYPCAHTAFSMLGCDIT